ncbi:MULTISPECIES: hypothetical protein [unclassified Streptomyces]|uniref:hypothetical protein n=1 Tax=unclassified Streptomyces TaxID=2593676 RepID=UPI000A46DF2C|nr:MULTISPECIES: hypothetical protein [unclassified Streptomyces]
MGYGPTGKMPVNLVDGCVRAKNVVPGSERWTPDGDRTARRTVARSHARKPCRERLTIRPGHEFGYFTGATCADGTAGRNHVSLVVDEERFATRYATALTACTGLPARLEAVTRPSGCLKRDLPGFRVRVVSSYPADALRHYAGGDAPHMRQGFPGVVLRDVDASDRRADRGTFAPEEHPLAPHPTFLLNGHLVREAR